MDAAQAHARAYGTPDYQAVCVAHPIASLLPEVVRERADEALARIIAVLMGRPERALPPMPEGRHRTSMP